jgi:hypothetical protein
MHRCEQNILAVSLVQPGPELGRRDAVSGKGRAVRVYHELFRLLQRLYDLLGPVSVVHVEVHDCDLFNFAAVLTNCIGRSKRHIVHEAEAIGTSFARVVSVESFAEDAGVVAWGSSGAEGIAGFSTHDSVHCPDGGAGRH